MNDNGETNKSESGGGAKVVGALILGAAIGAGLGYLFASEEGKELRKKVVDKVKDFVDTMKEKAEEHHCPNCNCNKEEKTT